MLISDRHRSLYEQYFAELSFEAKPSRWQRTVEELARFTGSESVLDYGCGIMALLSKFSDLSITNYDPGVPEYAALPEPADLVVCLDVIEHVEPKYTDAVLEHVISLAKKALLLTISTQESSKLLPDGSPWHCFVKDADWWRNKLKGFSEEPAMDGRAEYVAVLYKDCGMNTDLTDEMVAGFRDKDSKKERFRSLYEKHNFLTAYSKHTDLRVEDNPIGAIGRVDEWESHGILQLDFLKELGMKPGHTLLDVGCGVGRASRVFAPYLDSGNYFGSDISEKALAYAFALAKSEGWGEKNPTFLINSDLDMFLNYQPCKEFDFLWAHSVFTHLPDWQIEKMIHNAAKIMRCKFAFTYKQAEQPQRSGLKQFQYGHKFFEGIAKAAGLKAKAHPMIWPASQRTIVLTKR